MSEEQGQAEKPWVCASETCGRDMMTVLDIGNGKVLVRCIACGAQTPPLQFSLAKEPEHIPMQ